MYAFMYQYVKMRQAEIEQEMKAIHLERLSRTPRKSALPWWRGILVKLGRGFVTTGNFLEKRYGLPAASSNSINCH